MLKPLLAALALAAAPAAARPFTAADLVGLDRIAEHAVSRDGRTAVWSLRETDLPANRGRTDLFLLDLTRPGAQPTRFHGNRDSNESAPAFAADGRTVYFLSNRSGSSQLWSAPVAGGAPRQVTTFGIDVAGFAVAPTGDRVAFWADADLDCRTLGCVAGRAKLGTQGSARTYDQLFARHWDTWAAGTKRSRLFTVPLADGAATGEPVAVSGALVGDVPSKPFGSGEEIAWSPDGRTLYFALREAGRTEAWSTNLDIFSAPADGSAAPVNLTKGRNGTDTNPAVSSDGRTLAWTAMARPGYEADRLVVWTRDLASGRMRALTGDWDRSAQHIAWAPDGRSLYVIAQDTGATPLFRVDARSGKVDRLTQGGSVIAMSATARGPFALIQSLTSPTELYRIGATPEKLTATSAAKLAGVNLGAPEMFSFKGANGDTVHGWVVKPAGLAGGAKAPVALLIHGGPQGSFNDSWSYRWNPQAFAGAGYAVVTIDFHGSTGYGQAFTDSINQDWGGKPLEDLRLGLAAAAAKYNWIDAANACALGGSYGGFMVNWIAGQWADGFKCLVNHAGIFDQRSMYYGTEELWFPEHDFGGPYFAVPQNYEKWNPAAALTTWKTPMLVIHGQLDYRVPYIQGLSTFTALQRRDVPSRLVMFPDENHWILKPANSLQWHREVLGWLDRHLKP